MPVIAPTPIDAGPDVPDSSDPEVTFDAQFEAFNAWQKNTLQPGINALAENVFDNATDAALSASAASDNAALTADDAIATADDRVQTALDRAAAAASAASAAAIAGAFVGTSTTAWTPAVGAATFATQSGEQYTPGVTLTIVSAGTPSAWGAGQVTSYSGTSLVMDITVINGSGSHADWNISLAGVQGPPGVGVTADAVGFHVTAGTTPKTLTVDVDLLASDLAQVAASQGEMEAGVETALRTMSPLRVAQAVAALAGSSIVRSARTANTILGAADSTKLIDITSGTFSQTFTAAATLGSGWFCWLKNSGTGDITLDPNASETIDGLTTFVMYPGETRLVQCDGSGFNSIVITPFYKVFTSTGTFVKPPGYSMFDAFIWSGGCSGGKDSSYAIRGGPGGGGFPFTLQAATLAASETVTVGAGGASRTTAGGDGIGGGNSSIGSLAIVYGAVSTQAGHIRVGGAALVVDSGTLFTDGFAAGRDNSAISVKTIYGGASGPNNGSVDSGSSLYGGAAGGSHDMTTARAGGTSIYGGNGGAASVTGDGVAGTAPGGGGGACKNTHNSGPGARGEVRIWGIA